MYILNLVLITIVFFLPAFIANAMPVVVSGLKLTPFLAKPINTTLFGKSKTYRGFIFGILGALVAGLVQAYFGLYEGLVGNGFIFFTIYLSFLLGFGALFGDLVKSFIKRRIGKKSGQSWPVFDQIDYVLGAILFSSFIIKFPIEVIVTALIISPLFSLLANMVAYKLKLKKVWW